MNEQKIKQNRWAGEEDGPFLILSLLFSFIKSAWLEFYGLVEGNCHGGTGMLMV